jgi:hypothetical protein
MLCTELAFSQSNAYALLVGANRVKQSNYTSIYPESSVAKSNEDAEKVNSMLSNAGFKQENIVQLTDTSANRENILMQLSNFSRKLKENDVFVFYYSGHGDTLIDISKDEIPFLYDQALVTYNNYIVDDELNVIWRSFQKGVKLYNIVDACFSGEMYKILFQKQFSKNMKNSKSNSILEDTLCFEYDLSQPYNMYYFGAAAKSRTTTPFSDGSGVLTATLISKYNKLKRENRVRHTLAINFFESICSPNINYIFIKIKSENDLMSSDFIFKH